MKIEVDQYSDIGGRSENEDSAGYRRTERGVVAVVADGLGGQGDGKAASQIVCDSLLSREPEAGLPDSAEIMRLFDNANRTLMSKQKNSFHMKTTAVYLCVADSQAVWAHVGDSRLYHLWNGKLCDYTLDHSAAQLAVYMGQITREQIPEDPGQSRLLRAMGVADEYPDIHNPIALNQGSHVFLLCSDGLWEYISDAEIEKAWSMTKTTGKFIQQLSALKNRRSKPNCDNNTAVAVYVEI